MKREIILNKFYFMKLNNKISSLFNLQLVINYILNLYNIYKFFIDKYILRHFKIIMNNIKGL